MYTRIESCRICGNRHLEHVLDLGEQMLTGVFPRSHSDVITVGPLRLVKCAGEDVCGLLQLEHSYDLSEMYGENYGYRSGLNSSMVSHLHNKVNHLLKLVDLKEGELVVDIGSNDCTTLKAYPLNGSVLVGVDPTGSKFKEYYPSHVSLIPDFFSSALIKEKFPNKKAKIITSFSMFYDLENPMSFMEEIHEVLAEDGIWVFEQSYMPSMLDATSYDTVCHEHLEYYSLSQIVWMADRVGFVIRDVQFNSVNGGSFSVIAEKNTGEKTHSATVFDILESEKKRSLDTLVPYLEFAKRVEISKSDLIEFISDAKSEGKSICALGASTKGNVLLQYCGLSESSVSFIGEVNPDKFGRYAPGTNIPIIPEDDLLRMNPDYLIVLPWHFKSFFVASEKFKNRNLVFPLPKLVVEV